MRHQNVNITAWNGAAIHPVGHTKMDGLTKMVIFMFALGFLIWWLKL
jgi:hypothetical protein